MAYCRNCGTELIPKEGTVMAYCRNCGTKLVVDEKKDTKSNYQATEVVQEPIKAFTGEREYCRNCGAELIRGEKRCPRCHFQATEVVMQGPIKASTGKMVAMWIFCALGGLIGIFLAANIVNSRYPDNTFKYIESSRNQAKAGLIIAIFWFVIAIVSRLL